ncbi:hypothetical protein [Streptomyces coerulescens]|uniref:Uncharacterized protein n=1 Tax=Streptomyces coerulescens TaxID=29304 RepID=A0ABW0CVE4_STRCD
MRLARLDSEAHETHCSSATRSAIDSRTRRAVPRLELCSHTHSRASLLIGRSR